MGAEQCWRRLGVLSCYAEGLKEVGGFLKFNKGGGRREKKKKGSVHFYDDVLSKTHSSFKLSW